MPQGLDQIVGATLISVRNGPGMRLRTAREAKGASSLEIAQELRLHPDVIKRIEDDDYDSTLPLVFIKGYLRAYAALVGVDPDQVIIEFMHLGLIDPVKQLHERITPPASLTQFHHDSRQYRSWVISGLIAAVIGGICAFMWYQYDDATPAAESTQLLNQVVPVEPVVIAPTVEPQPAPTPQVQAITQPQPQPTPPPVVVQSAPKPAPVAVESRPKSRVNPQEEVADRDEEAMLF